MQYDPKLEGPDPPSPSPQLSRAQSRSSDRDRTPSISSSSLLPPPVVSPEPAYIAPSAAAHVVNSEMANTGQSWPIGDDVDDEDAVTVSPAALSLINSFLDQLLFSFLASSRSTSILSLRPAISEILKPRLAKEAIDGADEELKGYMAGGDDEELLDFHNGQELKGGSNLHQIFRRTRLRCMVYTRLGDMEEEDEDEYLDGSSPQEGDSDRHRLSRDLGNVSPAAAIFLTSIIEFLGEQALIIAGDNAYTRLTSKKLVPGSSQRFVVEDRDVEKIAFNKTLGRLWRSWKKRGRMSAMNSARLSSHEHHGQGRSLSDRASRTTSVSEEGDSNYFGEDPQHQLSVAEVLERRPNPARDIPPKARDLPEEPDFSSDTDDLAISKANHDRPRSIGDFRWPVRQVLAENFIQQRSDRKSQSQTPDARPAKCLQRSSSLPTIKTTPYSSPVDESFTTPTEGPDPFLVDHDERMKAEKEMPQLTDDSRRIADLSRGNPAISTMYDGVLKRHSKPIPIDPSLQSRGASMSEYSDQAFLGADTDMTPQALNFNKGQVDAADDTGTEGKSRASTFSSNYSFQAGEQSPLASTGDVTQKGLPKQADQQDVSSLPLAGSHDQSRIDPGNFASLAVVQGDRLKTYDDSGKAVKRSIPVLYEEPSNEDVIYDPEASKGVLSEEGALPTSTITDFHDIAEAGAGQYGSVPPPSGDLNQHTTAATKIVDMRKSPPKINTGTERAAVQRVVPSNPPNRELSAHGRKVSASSNKDGRPVTANSSTSGMSTKIKGIIGRDSGDAIRQPLPRTTSSEIGREMTDGSPRSGSKEQDFEQLMRSEETIQYTLTPQSMREMENPDSPRWSTNATFSDSARPTHLDQDVAAAGPGPGKSVPPTRSIKSLRGLNGLRANPTKGSEVMEFASPTSNSPTTRSHPQPPPKSPSGKPRNVVARDAAAQDDSMRDFADFIRSTGPDSDLKTMGGSAPNKPIAHSRGGSGASQQVGAKTTSKKITKPSPAVAPKQAEPMPPTRMSSKLRARDPIASPTNTTADLADFLRSGPPGAQGSQRSVSSPQPNGRMREGVISRISQDSFAPSKMTQSSSNSRTGLLDTTNRGQPVRNNSQNARKDEPPAPVRKQRRVRDPYAIDSDDEDDPYGNPIEPEREEESLSDFLRNYAPPSTATGRPQQTGPNSPQGQDSSNKRRKGSGVTMRERLARNIAVIPDYRPLPPKAPKKAASKSPPVSNEKRQQAYRTNSGNSDSVSPHSQRGRPVSNTPHATTAAVAAPQLPLINPMSNPRATSPHLISQNGTKMDTYRPTQPTYAKHVDRRPKPQLQARDETRAIGGGGGGGSGMADLADFLRETEPPAPSGPISNGGGGGGAMRGGPVSPAGKKEAGWSGMFGRKKKSVM